MQKLTADQIASLNSPRGYLLNGKIVPTVTSNNLTVAIKTLAGADPSATDPVAIRIGDTIQLITSALAKTINAGTNWFNAGSAVLATKEIDYFVYLGYNATDGVTIGFSRIPFATSYDEFSVTTTSEKYCAISTITNAAATDFYENIGRFAATLSAGAGYTWSVPTFTAKNLIQRPIFETRFLSIAGTLTALSGTPTTTSYGAAYKIVGNTCYLSSSMSITNKGTASGDIRIPVPFNSTLTAIGSARENAIAGIMGFLEIDTGVAFAIIGSYANATMWVSGYGILSTVTYGI
jgi:hypothetical protein